MENPFRFGICHTHRPLPDRRPDIQTLDKGKADLKEDEIIQLRMNFEEEIE